MEQPVIDMLNIFFTKEIIGLAILVGYPFLHIYASRILKKQTWNKLNSVGGLFFSFFLGLMIIIGTWLYFSWFLGFLKIFAFPYTHFLFYVLIIFGTIIISLRLYNKKKSKSFINWAFATYAITICGVIFITISSKFFNWKIDYLEYIHLTNYFLGIIEGFFFVLFYFLIFSLLRILINLEEPSEVWDHISKIFNDKSFLVLKKKITLLTAFVFGLGFIFIFLILFVSLPSKSINSSELTRGDIFIAINEDTQKIDMFASYYTYLENMTVERNVLGSILDYPLILNGSYTQTPLRSSEITSRGSLKIYQLGGAESNLRIERKEEFNFNFKPSKQFCDGKSCKAEIYLDDIIYAPNMVLHFQGLHEYMDMREECFNILADHPNKGRDFSSYHGKEEAYLSFRKEVGEIKPFSREIQIRWIPDCQAYKGR